MIWHHHKFMERECALIAIFDHAANQKLRVFIYLKDCTVLPSLRGDEVGETRHRAVRQAAQNFPQGLKPQCSGRLMSELKLRPPKRQRFRAYFFVGITPAPPAAPGTRDFRNLIWPSWLDSCSAT